MTHCLIREILYDYGNEKVPIDLKADIDYFIEKYDPRRILRWFSYGFTSNEIALLCSTPVLDVEMFLQQGIALLGEYLEIHDSLLYMHTKETKHGTLLGFLKYYERCFHLTTAKEIGEEYKRTL